MIARLIRLWSPALALFRGSVLRRLGADSLVGPGLPSARATDDDDWNLISGGGGPADRQWSSLKLDLQDSLEAWRLNAWVRQIVRLTTAYVVGDGLQVTSHRRAISRFVQEFWDHRQNGISARLAAWCDELTRSGELFIALFPNPVDGMQYVRAVPASQIERVETDPEDYEHETAYLERIPGQFEPKRWVSARDAQPGEACLLHYTVNKPVGATRGESDLAPLLPWARRYTDWLKGRVRFNEMRNKLATAEIILDDDTQVSAKRAQYAADPPTDSSIFVHGKGEELKFPAANIAAFEASGDGQALRLAMATAGDIPLHFFSEGDSATRATAVEMGDPTHRFYRQRQRAFGEMLVNLCEVAYLRHSATRGARGWWGQRVDLGLTYDAPDISRADNQALASSAASIVTAFATMADRGWITDELAIRLAFRFAGEILSDEQIQSILEAGNETQTFGADERGSDSGSDETGSNGNGRLGLLSGAAAPVSGDEWGRLPGSWRP